MPWYGLNGRVDDVNNTYRKVLHEGVFVNAGVKQHIYSENNIE
jgi:hypothetical protein